jgi:hypothetical protein
MKFSKAFGAQWIVFALVVGAAGARAADAAAGPGSPYGNEIRQLMSRLRTRQALEQSLTNTFLQHHAEFTKADIRLLREETQAYVESCQKAIDAYRKGDEVAGRTLAREAEKLKEGRDWRKRLDARWKQAENWHSESWADEMQTKWGGARAHAYGAEWVQAARRASAAWGHYAESFAPGVDREKQLALEEAAHLAEAEARATEERWRIRQTIDDRLWDKTVTSPELDAKIHEFEKFGDKVIDIVKLQRTERDQRLREWQRDRSKMERELVTVFDAARKQQEAARRTAPK